MFVRQCQLRIQVCLALSSYWRCQTKNGPDRELGEYEEFVLMDLILALPGVYLRELQEHLYVPMLVPEK